MNNIFNGNVLIANNIEYTNQVIKQDVTVGDFSSLSHALKQLGVTEEGILLLKQDLEADGPVHGKGPGAMASDWVSDIGKYIGKEGLKVGVEVAKKAAIKWIMQHCGLDI